MLSRTMAQPWGCFPHAGPALLTHSRFPDRHAKSENFLRQPMPFLTGLGVCHSDLRGSPEAWRAHSSPFCSLFAE